MERGEFNDLMQNAFKDAEATPSENVWTNIELELEKEEGGAIRRRLFYYKMVAAASVIFALSVAAASLYVVNSSSNFQNQQALLKNSSSVLKKAETENQEQPIRLQKEIDSNNNVSSKEIIKEDGGSVLNKTSAQNDAVDDNDKSNTQNEMEGNSRGSLTKGLSDNKASTKSKINYGVANNVSDKNPVNSLERITNGVKSNEEVSPENNATNISSASNTLQSTENSGSSSTSLATISTNATSQENQKLNNQNIQRVIDRNPMLLQFEPIQTASVSGIPRKLKPISIKSENTEVKPDAGALLLAQLAERELALQAEQEKKESRSERLWTSVGVAAGSFSSTNSSVSPAALANASFNQNASAAASQQTKASGSTYSVGINVGTKVANRWIVQGGLNYMTQGSDYTAGAVVASSDFKNFGVASLNDLARDAKSSQVVSTASYKVNNTLQYLNVPLQAGYIIINRKVSVQLNTGVSTDLFLQNTLTPESGDLDKTTQGSGSESPYRTVNFSGLVGTEISYKMGKHYRLALNPGVRYPFNSIYKSDVGVSASPLTFDVGLRFRYIFH